MADLPEERLSAEPDARTRLRSWIACQPRTGLTPSVFESMALDLLDIETRSLRRTVEDLTAERAADTPRLQAAAEVVEAWRRTASITGRRWSADRVLGAVSRLAALYPQEETR